MKRAEDGDGGGAITGVVAPTPDRPHPYMVVVRWGGVVLRSKPVETLREGERLLSRLLAEVAPDSADYA